MAMYSALRDAFNDMNKMFIDRQNWQAEHERRAEMDAFNRDQQERAMRSQELKDEITAVQAVKAKRLITPKDFSVYQMGDPDAIREVMNKPEAASMMERAVDDNGIGYKYSPADGTFVTKDGKRLQMSPLQIQNRAMALYGIIDMYDKKPEAIQLNLMDLQEQKKQLVSDKKKYAGEARFIGHQGQYDTQLSAINADIRRHQTFLDPKSGEMLKYYTNKAQRFRKRAAWAANMGIPELAQEFGRESNSMANNAALALKALMTKATKTGTKKVTWYATHDGVINPVTNKPMKQNDAFNEYIPVGAEGAMSRDGFSPSKVDTKKEDSTTASAWMSARDRRVKAGQSIIDNRTLPSGMMIPKTAKNTAFFDAATKEYNRNIHKFGKNMFELEDAQMAASKAIQTTIQFHEQAMYLKESLTGAKKVRGKWVLGDGRPTTAKRIKQARAQLKALRNRLGYMPKWRFKYQENVEQATTPE